jgi:hypothetical protein
VEVRRLIREMSLANQLWGAPRIHGELLKLGIEVAQSTVAKYMARSGRGRPQTWKTFLQNHSAGIGAMVSLDPSDPHDRSSRDARALASGRLSLLLALEVSRTGADCNDASRKRWTRCGPGRARAVDPCDQ